MHAAHFFFFFFTSTPPAPRHSLTPSIFCLHFPTPLFPLLLSSLTSTVFVLLLGFVCLLFPDGRRRLHLSSFQVPREIFTALAQALILFPLAGLYDGPFIRSNWKQLSLPVWVRRIDRKFRFFFFPFFSQRAPRLNIAMGESVVVEDIPPPSALIITLIGFRE